MITEQRQGRTVGQLALTLDRVLVVPNRWAPVYHVQDEHGRVVWYCDQPGLFWSIEEAVAFARARGCEPEVPDATRTAWAHWTTEQVAEYRAQCGRNGQVRRDSAAPGGTDGH